MLYDYHVYDAKADTDFWTESAETALARVSADPTLQLTRYKLIVDGEGFRRTLGNCWQLWDGQEFGPWVESETITTFRGSYEKRRIVPCHAGHVRHYGGH